MNFLWLIKLDSPLPELCTSQIGRGLNISKTDNGRPDRRVWQDAGSESNRITHHRSLVIKCDGHTECLGIYTEEFKFEYGSPTNIC